MADHLSRLVNEEVTQEEQEIWDKFPNESLLSVGERPWFADIANYKQLESFQMISIGICERIFPVMHIFLSGIIHVSSNLEWIIC